jgi:hypothetical protein
VRTDGNVVCVYVSPRAVGGLTVQEQGTASAEAVYAAVEDLAARRSPGRMNDQARR